MAEEPASKKAKTEDNAEADTPAEATEEAKEEKKEGEEKKEEGKKEPEKPKELEEDASTDGRSKVDASSVSLSETDCTLNVMPVSGGNLVMTLTEGGCQYLLAGVRGTTGVKAGRYMFEVKICELLNPGESQNSQGKTPQPRQLVKVGVSTAGSSLFLSDWPDNVCFDSEGMFIYQKTRKKQSQKFTRDQTVALLINLDESSPNKNTISLFRDGVRISEPQALPEALVGKTLYPTITYKNVTLQVNFGPAPRVALPFTCRMLADAASADVEIAAASAPADDKYEVVFPVGLPEQGFFDWVDEFCKKNPGYTELSDRKIAEWASKSGIWRPKAAQPTGSNDKPDMKFGIQMMDDMSVRRVISAIAPTLKRNYVVPELKKNLLAADRKTELAKFGSSFKKTATVLMGEPSTEYKEQVGALILAEKQAKADAEKKKKAQEAERKRLLEEKKKKAEEARKAKEAALKKKAGEEESKEEEKEEEKKEEEAAMEEDTPIELTEEEKALWYRKFDTPDLTDQVLTKNFANFSLPTAEEGFDSVSYVWQTEAASTALLKDFVLKKKLTSRVEDLKPGEWFTEAWSKWTKQLGEWKKRQGEWRDPKKKKELLAKRKEEAKKKKEEEKKKEAEEAGEKAEGEEKEEKKEEEKEPEEKEINADDIEMEDVQDIMDLGNGEPLFANFLFEDWTLLSTRFELCLLVHAFKKDLNDSDRPSFSEEHLAFYYQRYFKKPFQLSTYSVKKLAELVEIIKESLAISENGFLEALHAEDFASADFVKLTEEHRRERQRRIDAGDETAKLKFTKPAPPQPARPPSGPPGGAARPGGYPSAGGAKPPYNSGGAGAGFGAQKRPYSPGPAPSYGAGKPSQPRTGPYYGGGGGGAYYRR